MKKIYRKIIRLKRNTFYYLNYVFKIHIQKIAYWVFNKLLFLLKNSIVILFCIILFYILKFLIIIFKDIYENNSLFIWDNVIDILKILIPSLFSTLAILYTIFNVKSTQKHYRGTHNPIFVIECKRTKINPKILNSLNYTTNNFLIDNFQDKYLKTCNIYPINCEKIFIPNDIIFSFENSSSISLTICNNNENPYYNLVVEIKSKYFKFIKSPLKKFKFINSTKTKEGITLFRDPMNLAIITDPENQFLILDNNYLSNEVNEVTIGGIEDKSTNKLNLSFNNTTQNKITIPIILLRNINSILLGLFPNLEITLKYQNKLGNHIKEKFIIYNSNLYETSFSVKKIY